MFESPYRRILFCTDFSENADHAFDYAVESALRTPGCELHLLHVVPEAEAQFWKTYLYEVEGVDEKAARDMDERMAKAYLSRLPESVPAQVAVRVGRDSEEILSFAEEMQADLIVMGRQGSSSLGTVLFGNVTEKVVRKAGCPVLVVPLKRHTKSRT